MSQFTIISQPPPKQMPLTAAIIGLRPPRRDTPPKPDAGCWRFFPSEVDLFHSVCRLNAYTLVRKDGSTYPSGLHQRKRLDQCR